MNWFKQWLADNWFSRLARKIRNERKYKKKLAEIKKRDPYIYK